MGQQQQQQQLQQQLQQQQQQQQQQQLQQGQQQQQQQRQQQQQQQRQQQQQQQPQKQQKINMLIAGSSLNRNLNQQVIKNVTDTNVTFLEAFTVDRDSNAHYPDKNFLKLVPEELERKEYTVLVLSCGPNEISNLNTGLNYSDNKDKWRQKA